MSYAIRKDGQGWRAVNSKEDCTKDEIFSETQPLPIAENTQFVINNESRAYLLKTDWYAIRFSETGEEIPTDILNKRSAARAAAKE